MIVERQAPQPTIKCYHSVENGAATKKLYQEFTPNSSNISGKNLQSYNFERSLDNFGGSFSFTVKEDIIGVEEEKNTFMDQVEPLDIIVISESGTEKIDFIGVVTTVSIGGIASNLNKVVTVSGKSIEWLFTYLNINCDIKIAIFNNASANATMKTDFADENGTTGFSIKKTVSASIATFRGQVEKNKTISNFIVGEIIDNWFIGDYIDADSDTFAYPISSDMFQMGKVNVIDFIKKLLPPPIYEIYCYIDNNNPKLRVRKVPFDNPESETSIKPELLTDYTLTRNCEEVYTSFLTYIEGTKLSPDYWMNLQAAEGELKGYNFSQTNLEKVGMYGFQLLTCSFVGYNSSSKSKLDEDTISILNQDLERWFSRLDEMYSGDFTMVNLVNSTNARMGEWVKFAKGLYYVVSERHSWNYGDNPMLNYQVIRGGEYSKGEFKPITKLSAIYKEFEE